MKIRILSKASRSSELINKWLAEKGAPEYAEIYQSAGERYGVAWDIAIFQSCLETGFWTFRGDVEESQNNFAGIGAVGGGVSGESFVSPTAGITAQIQHLATYAGFDIPEQEIVANRTKNVKSWILGKVQYWNDFGNGKWAADPEYFQKIQSLMADYDEWSKKQTGFNPEKVTYWVKMFRDGRFYLMRKSGGVDEAVDYIDTERVIAKFSEVVERFGKLAGMYAIAPEGEEYPEVKDPIVIETPKPDTTGLIVNPEVANPGGKDVWVPWAKDFFPRMYTKFQYPDKFPSGAIVHYTVSENITGSLNYLRGLNLPCLGIGRDGTLWQPFPLNRGGSHSGTWHHNEYVGIEISCWGKLNKKNGRYYTKTKYPKEIPAHRVRYIPDDTPNGQFGGYYEMYTEAQEKTLIKFLLWCKINAPRIFSFDRVLGHDEAYKQANKRGKTDPGGSLSMPMPEFRELLHEQYKIWKA